MIHAQLGDILIITYSKYKSNNNKKIIKYIEYRRQEANQINTHHITQNCVILMPAVQGSYHDIC